MRKLNTDDHSTMMIPLHFGFDVGRMMEVNMAGVWPSAFVTFFLALSLLLMNSLLQSQPNISCLY